MTSRESAREHLVFAAIGLAFQDILASGRSREDIETDNISALAISVSYAVSGTLAARDLELDRETARRVGEAMIATAFQRALENFPAAPKATP